jgi:hypothetical protein
MILHHSHDRVTRNHSIKPPKREAPASHAVEAGGFANVGSVKCS